MTISAWSAALTDVEGTLDRVEAALTALSGDADVVCARCGRPLDLADLAERPLDRTCATPCAAPPLSV